MATRKKVAKWIREQAKKLPPDFYEAGRKFYEPRREKNDDGKDILVLGDWVKYPVNHARRARKAYIKGGFKELNKYFKRYGYKLIRT